MKLDISFIFVLVICGIGVIAWKIATSSPAVASDFQLDVWQVDEANRRFIIEIPSKCVISRTTSTTYDDFIADPKFYKIQCPVSNKTNI